MHANGRSAYVCTVLYIYTCCATLCLYTVDTGLYAYAGCCRARLCAVRAAVCRAEAPAGRSAPHGAHRERCAVGVSAAHCGPPCSRASQLGHRLQRWGSAVRLRADSAGVLSCLDGCMNVALEDCREYVQGDLKNEYGDAFIRGNNVLYIAADVCGDRAAV
ncbi:U6 snRNA-associated Sm-like protein LSm6 [Pneumocystis jirovecii RU7]|uniref:U6 snRNA-associated Sm-like protein LSm6 n=1 Tax=Pneumocystis jirovecii (strain RU7) TaxID=1408657 RepID=A0A0W4ZUY4_PNEJ7|nr:U6 snRNA-associated Sm-like protein LSm6 [Pneumocystis jirovecii RU7]KTW32164.1 U6 snRNA-associated Sm-like protein LSm6 [Pneumocystis jirovecii RU7]